jgi:hypothetical protein
MPPDPRKMWNWLEEWLCWKPTRGYTISLLSTLYKQRLDYAIIESASFLAPNYLWNKVTDVDFEGFWRWCMMYRTMRFILDFIHRLDCKLYLASKYRDKSKSSGNGTSCNYCRVPRYIIVISAPFHKAIVSTSTLWNNMASKKELYTAVSLIGVRNEQLDILPTYPSTYLPTYRSMALWSFLLDLCRYFSFLILLWRACICWAGLRGARSRGNARHTATLGFDGAIGDISMVTTF